MKVFYKGIIDEFPVEVSVIQYGSKGKRVEIIRKTQNGNAGFWVDTSEINTQNN